MNGVELLMLVAGLAMLGELLHKMNAAAVMASISAVGWGFSLLITQELVAHVFNSLGWLYSIAPKTADKFRFGRILLMRIAGDGVNYLTPSATLAGEWARAAMMGGEHSLDERLSSVALAKITQTLAMALTSVVGVVCAFSMHANFADLGPMLRHGSWLVAAIIGFIVFLEVRAGKSDKTMAGPASGSSGVWAQLKNVDHVMMSFLRLYPGRFALSVFCFLVAYLWGAFEAYWICRFLGVPVSVPTAVLIEMLAVFLDGIFFAVPGKAGTQEATKVAIFSALGYLPQTGLAFGIVRHIREMFWAVTGFSLYYISRIKNRIAAKPADAAQAAL
jgi:uncharacterized membrane protein YbhN (UPF0104 family)